MSRLASVMASITRAVPATLICHMRSTSSTPVRTGSSTNARWTTADGLRIPQQNRKAGGRILLLPGPCARSAAADRSRRRVMSTPITSNSASCGSRRVPRLPEIPVTTTVGFGSPIYLGPDSGALAGGAFSTAAGSFPGGAAAGASAKYFSFNSGVADCLNRLHAHPGYAASARWKRFRRALCRAAECPFLQLCRSGIRLEW